MAAAIPDEITFSSIVESAGHADGSRRRFGDASQFDRAKETIGFVVDAGGEVDRVGAFRGPAAAG